MNLSTFWKQEAIQQKRALTVLACLRLASGILTALGAFCTTQILSTVIDHTFSMQKAVPFFGVLLFVVLWRTFLGFASRRNIHRILLEAEEHLRCKIHQALLARSPLAVEPETGGALLGLACESIRRLDAAFTTVLPALLDLAMLVPLYLAFFFLTDVWSGLLALITLPIAPFLLTLIGRVTRERSEKEYHTMLRMGSLFTELLRAIPMLKLFGREAVGRDRVATASERFSRAALAVLRVAFVSSFALELITTLSIALIAVSLGLRLVAGSIDFAPAFFLLLLAPEFYAPLAAGGTAFHAGMEASEALAHILRFMEEPCGSPSILPSSNDHKNDAAVTFANVTASYPRRVTPAVRNLTFSIPYGRITALKGTSGAGKSTVFALALGFLQPKSGNILRAFPESIAYVPQEPHLFHTTLRENLLFGREATEERLLDVLQRAGLSTFFSRLPNGLDTMLGDGERLLSGGERKRLGLARTLVVPPKLYLFDEVTAGLDEENERLVLQTMQALRDSADHPAILLASHRDSTLAVVDNIITLDGGHAPSSLQNHNTKFIDANAPSLPIGEVPRLRGGGGDVVGRFATLPKGQRISNVATPSPLRGAPQGEPLGMCVHPFNDSNALPPRRGGLESVLRLLPLGLTLLALCSGLAADASAVLLLGASAWLIASAAFHPHLSMLALAITAVRAAGIGRAVFRYLDRFLSHRAVFTLLTRLRLAAYALACARLPERTSGPASGTFLQQATAGVDELRDFYLRTLFPLVRIGVIVCMTAFLVAQEQRALALVPLACALLIAFASAFTRNDTKESLAEANYRSALLDAYAGRAEILAFGGTRFFATRLNVHARTITTARQETLQQENRSDAISEALPSVAWVGLFVTLAETLPVLPAQAEAVHFAVIVLVLETLLRFMEPLANVLRKIKPALERARFLLPQAPANQKALPLGELSSESETERVDRRRSQANISTGSSRLATDLLSPPLRGTSPRGGGVVSRAPLLEATSIAFSYAASTPTLHNVSFSLQPAEKLLLLGESGAGKTTLFHLLARLWEPDAGAFMLNGQAYPALPVADVRAAFAAATQAGYLFSGSIRENFHRFLPMLPDELQKRALSIAVCDFASNLPQGIDTPIGEDGARLSGGQRQRVLDALAIGALLLDPTKILLLDEPTTGLDHKTAERFFQNLMEAFPSQAMILILHDRALATQLLLRHDARVIELSRCKK